MLCHVTRMLVTLLLNAVTWRGGALGTKNICESGRKNKQTNKQINSCSVKCIVSSPVRQTSWKCWPCTQQIYVIDYAWSQDGLILPETKMKSIKRQKKKAARISSHLERTSLVNKGYYYTDKKKTSSCGTDSENLRRARWASSQSEHRIQFTLTARGFAHIKGQFIALPLSQKLVLRTTVLRYLVSTIDDGARKSNNWLDQWQSGKLGTGSRVQWFPRSFLPSIDVSVLLLNQPIINLGKHLSSGKLWILDPGPVFLLYLHWTYLYIYLFISTAIISKTLPPSSVETLTTSL